MKNENTFGEYTFPSWVPEHTQEIIKSFWGQMGRTYKDWLNDSTVQGVRELCTHGPGPNGFGIPQNGATVFFFIKDWEASKEKNVDLFIRVKGRYVHRWNNMGSLIDDDGKDHTVSSCDCWVRVYQKEESLF